jgi:hypothetical protein
MNEPESEEFEEAGLPAGRRGGGESGGGAYPNPHRGKKAGKDGFLGSGGQSGKAYHGGDNPNAPAGGRESAEECDDEGP